LDVAKRIWLLLEGDTPSDPRIQGRSKVEIYRVLF
jgi:hypothetical protein